MVSEFKGTGETPYQEGVGVCDNDLRRESRLGHLSRDGAKMDGKTSGWRGEQVAG